MKTLEQIGTVNRKALLVYRASEYHNRGDSIPVKLFEELCAVGEKPTLLYQEFNEDSDKPHVELFPLLDKSNLTEFKGIKVMETF